MKDIKEFIVNESNINQNEVVDLILKQIKTGTDDIYDYTYKLLDSLKKKDHSFYDAIEYWVHNVKKGTDSRMYK